MAIRKSEIVVLSSKDVRIYEHDGTLANYHRYVERADDRCAGTGQSGH